MSGFITLQPSPFQLGAIGATDQDGAWLIDCTAWCTARGVTIVSVGITIVRRQDGKTIAAEDIVVSAEAVVASPVTRNGVTVQAGKGFTFNIAANGNATNYYLGFPLTDSSGNVVTRWAELPVISMLG